MPHHVQGFCCMCHNQETIHLQSQPGKRKAVVLDQLPPSKAARKGKGKATASAAAAAELAQRAQHGRQPQGVTRRPVVAANKAASASQPSRAISR